MPREVQPIEESVTETHNVQELLAGVVRRLAGDPAVAAIALVGSRTSGAAASGSDFDLFVYSEGDLSALRSSLADELGDSNAWRSVKEGGFGDTDVWRLRHGGQWLDLMYWSPAWAERVLRRLLVEHQAEMGYTTAFWRSIRDAHPLYERDDWHADLQRRARQAYPDELRRSVVHLNHPYLRDHPFSFRQQTASAIRRRDVVSVNHRVAAWLASYFDVVFAVNRVLHPGEKRLLEFVARECPSVPEGMASSVEHLLRLAGSADAAVMDAMDALTDSLDLLLRREGLLPG